MTAAVAGNRLPGREQDVGDVAERPALARSGVGANPSRNFERFAAELEADAVLGVAAVDFVADADARVDVAAAALEEQRETTEAALEHVARRTGEVGRGDGGPPADGDRMG